MPMALAYCMCILSIHWLWSLHAYRSVGHKVSKCGVSHAYSRQVGSSNQQNRFFSKATANKGHHGLKFSTCSFMSSMLTLYLFWTQHLSLDFSYTTVQIAPRWAITTVVTISSMKFGILSTSTSILSVEQRATNIDFAACQSLRGFGTILMLSNAYLTHPLLWCGF